MASIDETPEHFEMINACVYDLKQTRQNLLTFPFFFLSEAKENYQRGYERGFIKKKPLDFNI